MPEETLAVPEAAQQPETPPAPAETPSGGEIPIARALRTVRNKLEKTGTRVDETIGGFRGWLRKVFKFDKSEVEETTLLKTPFVAAGKAADGTALNGLRRVQESFIEPGIDFIKAFTRATIGKVLHPVHSLTHPVETAKDVVHIGTLLAVAAKNTAVAPVRGGDELVDRGINQTSQQLNTKVSKFPILGGLYSKVTNFFTGLAAKVTNTFRETVDWLTNFVDKIHDATAPKTT